MLIPLFALFLASSSAAFSPVGRLNRSSPSAGSVLVIFAENGDVNGPDAPAVGVEDEEDEDTIFRLLRGPLGNQATAQSTMTKKAIFILSDTTGGTAKSVVEKSLTQFNGCDDRFQIFPPSSSNSEDDEDCELIQTKMHTFCRTESQVANVIRKAAAMAGDGASAMVVYTLADPELRESAARMCELEGLVHVDLLGPMFSSMAALFQREPLGHTITPSNNNNQKRRRRSLSDAYYSRIEAVEFTLKADDGMAPWLLPEADVILVGVSRTGKTPLSVVLSQAAGIKVANVPLVMEVLPPRQLLDKETIDSRRVFCLTLNPGDLQRIRKTRLERELGSESSEKTQSNYADRAYLIKDLMTAKRLADDQGWTEIDVTGRAVEETASLISSILKERFPDEDD
jgi:regulator of PEP synthase PpsR (kinase-PPPase family)